MRLANRPGGFLRSWGFGAEKSARIGYPILLIVGGSLFSNPVLGFGLITATAYAVGYPAAVVVRTVGWVIGYRYDIPVSPHLVLLLSTFFVVAFIAIPALWFEKERALAPIRVGIHASLAAALPEHPGGPSRCRTCGAALDVPSGALGVPCSYCKSDNLVALPPDWVTQIQAREFRHFQRIDAGMNAFREAAHTAHERFWKLTVGLVLIFPLILAVAYAFDNIPIEF